MLYTLEGNGNHLRYCKMLGEQAGSSNFSEPHAGSEHQNLKVWPPGSTTLTPCCDSKGTTVSNGPAWDTEDQNFFLPKGYLIAGRIPIDGAFLKS